MEDGNSTKHGAWSRGLCGNEYDKVGSFPVILSGIVSSARTPTREPQLKAPAINQSGEGDEDGETDVDRKWLDVWSRIRVGE